MASFLGIQNNFLYNIVDDIEYLNESDFFHKNKNNYFSDDSAEYDELIGIQILELTKRKLYYQWKTRQLSDVEKIDG